MAKFAIKMIIILFFALSLNAFADGGYYGILELLPAPVLNVSYDTNKAGMVRTTIGINDLIYNKTDYDFFIIIHDKTGKLLSYKHRIYKNGLLIQTTDDGVVKNIARETTECDSKIIGASGSIVPLKCPAKCDFKVIESSGSIVHFKLDPAKPPEVLLMSLKDEDSIFFKHLEVPKIPLENKYDEIVYNRWEKECQYAHRKIEKIVENPDSSDYYSGSGEGIDAPIKYEDNAFQYKYYAITAICVVLAGVVIVRKRRKAKW